MKFLSPFGGTETVCHAGVSHPADRNAETAGPSDACPLTEDAVREEPWKIRCVN